MGQSEPGSNCYEKLRQIFQSSRTGALPSDGLVSYRGHSLKRGLTHLQSCNQLILQPQTNKTLLCHPKHLLYRHLQHHNDTIIKTDARSDKDTGRLL